MNAVTSPLTWSFLTTIGRDAGVLSAADRGDTTSVISSGERVKPITGPGAIHPTLYCDIMTGTEDTETLSESDETALAWFLVDDTKKISNSALPNSESQPLQSGDQSLQNTSSAHPPRPNAPSTKPTQCRTSTQTFFAALQAMARREAGARSGAA